MFHDFPNDHLDYFKVFSRLLVTLLQILRIEEAGGRMTGVEK
jgi:hypothetical protein